MFLSPPCSCLGGPCSSGVFSAVVPFVIPSEPWFYLSCVSTLYSSSLCVCCECVCIYTYMNVCVFVYI